jgi:hypothetical protein
VVDLPVFFRSTDGSENGSRLSSIMAGVAPSDRPRPGENCCRLYARAWSARNRQPRQAHRGPITRAFLDVLQALLWGFYNSRSGCCFPSYEADRRQGRVPTQHGCRGAEGPGVPAC